MTHLEQLIEQRRRQASLVKTAWDLCNYGMNNDTIIRQNRWNTYQSRKERLEQIEEQIKQLTHPLEAATILDSP